MQSGGQASPFVPSVLHPVGCARHRAINITARLRMTVLRQFNNKHYARKGVGIYALNHLISHFVLDNIQIGLSIMDVLKIGFILPSPYVLD